MNHSAADVLHQALVDVGTVLAPDESQVSWQCFVDGMPSTPDEAVVLIDEDGHDDGRSMIDGELFYHYGVQMILRGRNHRTGYKKAEVIRQSLASLYRRSVNVESDSYRLHCVAHIGSVLCLGKEVPNSKRSIFTLNMSVAYRSVASTLVPTIISFAPPTGDIGDTVTIVGTNFLGATSVLFNGVGAAFVVVDSSHITATVPNSTSGPISVTNAFGTIVSSDNFTYVPVIPGAAIQFIEGGDFGLIEGGTLGFLLTSVYPVPQLTSISTTVVTIGTVVTLQGTGFYDVSDVKFNGVSATSFTVIDDLSLTAVVPVTINGGVTVATPGGTSNGIAYSFLNNPVITSFTPATGPKGLPVIITGTNFTGAVSVKFGGVEAQSFVVNSSTQVTAFVPVCTAGAIVVQLAPGVSGESAGSFTYVELSDGLVSHWPENEPDATLRSDVFNVTNMSVTNITRVSGQLSSFATGFDGAASRLTVAGGSTILPATGSVSFTFATWIKTTRTTLQGIAGKGRSVAGYEWGMFTGAFAPDGKPSFGIYSFDASSFNFATGPVSIADGNWHLVAGGLDLTAGKVFLSVDGGARIEVARSAGIPGFAPSVFGIGWFDNTNFFLGSQQLGTFWLSALSNAQLAALRHGGVPITVASNGNWTPIT